MFGLPGLEELERRLQEGPTLRRMDESQVSQNPGFVRAVQKKRTPVPPPRGNMPPPQNSGSMQVSQQPQQQAPPPQAAQQNMPQQGGPPPGMPPPPQGQPPVPQPPRPLSADEQWAKYKAQMEYQKHISYGQQSPLGGIMRDYKLNKAMEPVVRRDAQYQQEEAAYQKQMMAQQKARQAQALEGMGWDTQTAQAIASGLKPDADLSKFKDRDKVQRDVQQRVDLINNDPQLKGFFDGLSQEQKAEYVFTDEISNFRSNTSYNIDGPDLPADHLWVDPMNPGEGVVVIPNSPTDRAMDTATKEELELQAAQRKELRTAYLEAENLMEQGMGALDQVNWMTTGIPGAFFRQISGTEAQDLANSIKTQQAAAAFERLQQMRNASVTGGALGNVSNKEIELLYNAWEQLDPNMSEPELKKSLENVMRRWDTVRFHLMNEERWQREETPAARQIAESTAYKHNRRAFTELSDRFGPEVATRFMEDVMVDQTAAKDLKEDLGVELKLLDGLLLWQPEAY